MSELEFNKDDDYSEEIIFTEQSISEFKSWKGLRKLII